MRLENVLRQIRVETPLKNLAAFIMKNKKMAAIAAVLVLLVSGLFFFRRMEKTFADVV